MHWTNKTFLYSYTRIKLKWSDALKLNLKISWKFVLKKIISTFLGYWEIAMQNIDVIREIGVAGGIKREGLTCPVWFQPADFVCKWWGEGIYFLLWNWLINKQNQMNLFSSFISIPSRGCFVSTWPVSFTMPWYIICALLLYFEFNITQADGVFSEVLKYNHLS